MQTVITLIGRKERPLTPQDVDALELAMAGRNLVSARRDWLCEGEACDVYAGLPAEDSSLSKWASDVAEKLGLDAVA
ncbi:MAG: hypothetical protein PHY92_04495, partial [Alphaproteobacteria bacterium]|nr:hypothetical protein [Alphaproteobacteria bacterium]